MRTLIFVIIAIISCVSVKAEDFSTAKGTSNGRSTYTVALSNKDNSVATIGRDTIWVGPKGGLCLFVNGTKKPVNASLKTYVHKGAKTKVYKSSK